MHGTCISGFIEICQVLLERPERCLHVADLIHSTDNVQQVLWVQELVLEIVGSTDDHHGPGSNSNIFDFV